MRRLLVSDLLSPDTSRLSSDDDERALAEFERAARRLEGLWPSLEGRGPVVLELHPNLEEYRTERGLQWSRGSVRMPGTRNSHLRTPGGRFRHYDRGTGFVACSTT